MSQNENRRKKKGKRKAADDSPIDPQFLRRVTRKQHLNLIKSRRIQVSRLLFKIEYDRY